MRVCVCVCGGVCVCVQEDNMRCSTSLACHSTVNFVVVIRIIHTGISHLTSEVNPGRLRRKWAVGSILYPGQTLAQGPSLWKQGRDLGLHCSIGVKLTVQFECHCLWGSCVCRGQNLNEFQVECVCVYVSLAIHSKPAHHCHVVSCSTST